MEAAGYTLKSCRPSDAPRCYCKFFDQARTVIQECYIPAGAFAQWLYNISIDNIARIAKGLKVEPWRLLRDE